MRENERKWERMRENERKNERECERMRENERECERMREKCVIIESLGSEVGWCPLLQICYLTRCHGHSLQNGKRGRERVQRS